MTGIKILQGQFEEAAKQYPGLRHTIVQRSKEGLDPETTALEYEHGNIDPDADYYVYRWSEYIDREPNETGYPSWHFLSRPSPQVWNVRHAEGLALVLAEEAGKCLIALPELEGLMIDNSAERWFLALHRIYPCTKLVYDSPPSEFHPTIPRLKLSGSWREAEPGEAYIEKLDNVFLKSAMLCGKLLASKQEPEEKEQKAKRIIAALLISLIMILLFELFVYFGPVTWFRNHPHSPGIQGSIDCLIFCMAVGFFKPRWRKWYWGAAIAFLVGLLSLL
jgi:hypothetical protein